MNKSSKKTEEAGNLWRHSFRLNHSENKSPNPQTVELLFGRSKSSGGVDLISFRCVLPDLEILKNTWHFNAGAVHPSLPSNRINTPNKSKEIEETWRIGALPVIDLSEQSPSLSIWAKNFMKCLWFFLPVPFFRCCILMQVQSSDGTMVSPRFLGTREPKLDRPKQRELRGHPTASIRRVARLCFNENFLGRLLKFNVRYIQVWKRDISFNAGAVGTSSQPCIESLHFSIVGKLLETCCSRDMCQKGITWGSKITKLGVHFCLCCCHFYIFFISWVFKLKFWKSFPIFRLMHIGHSHHPTLLGSRFLG